MFHLTIEGDVARLRLGRPQVRNAIPAEGWRDLQALVEGSTVRAARLLVIEGDRASFCAGADLGDLAAMAGDSAACAAFRCAMRGALDALAALGIPTIALIEGACFGAGVALAMACDIRIAGHEARFAITPARLGIAFPQQDIARLVGLVGRQEALILLLTANTIDARRPSASGS